jgi:hypothetical protein
MEQIKERKYFEKHLVSNDKIVLVGAAFDKGTRNIEEFVFETVKK